jgi:hypothetical protein
MAISKNSNVHEYNQAIINRNIRRVWKNRPKNTFSSFGVYICLSILTHQFYLKDYFFPTEIPQINEEITVDTNIYLLEKLDVLYTRLNSFENNFNESSVISEEIKNLNKTIINQNIPGNNIRLEKSLLSLRKLEGLLSEIRNSGIEVKHKLEKGECGLDIRPFNV